MADNLFQKILIIRMSALGDIILTTPLLRAVAEEFPEAEIDFLTKKQFAEVLKYHPRLSRVLGFEPEQGFFGLLKLIRKLRAEKYDLVIDLHINPRSILVRYLSGARLQRRYFKRSLERRLLKWFRLNFLKNSQPVAERYFTALEDFGIFPDGRSPEIYFSERESEKARRIIGERADQPLVGLAPGASRYTKRWPADRFAQLGEWLAQRLNAQIFILGGEQDVGVSNQVREMLTGKGIKSALDLTGELNILETSALINELDLIISNDTALMHIATAVDTPVLAIFGPTSRELGFFPYSPKAQVIELDLKCRPCSLHGDKKCPKGHFECMLGISPEMVFEKAQKMLSQ